MEILWHQYEIGDIDSDLKSQLLQEVQHNNLINDRKILLDFSWGTSVNQRWVSVSIYDDDPYQSFFVLKYGDYILRSHSGVTVIFGTEHTRPAVSIENSNIS